MYFFSGSIRLCTENTVWNPKGITVAGLLNGLPSTLLEGLQCPKDIYVYGDGTILVADYDNNRITKWDPNATRGVLIAGTVQDDRMYMSDLENYRIQVFPLNTNLISPEAITLIGRYGQGSNIDHINQVASIVASYLNPSLLYMADSKNHRVLVWDYETGTTQLVAGESNTFGSDSMRLHDPSDTDNHRIFLWLNGARQGRTIAGNDTLGNSDYQLNNPSRIRFDSANNLYV
ncbi:unnamed protein product, partial [Rotaria socialis]